MGQGGPMGQHGGPHGPGPMRFPGEQMLSSFPGANRMPMPPQGMPRLPGPPMGQPGMHPRAGFRNPMPPNLPTTPLPVSAAASSGSMGNFPLQNMQQQQRMPSVPCTTAPNPVSVPGSNCPMGPKVPMGANGSIGPNGPVGPNGPNGPTPSTTAQQPSQRMPQMPMQQQPRPPQASPNMNSVGPPPPYLGNQDQARMALQSKYRLGTPKEGTYRMGNPNVRPQQQQSQTSQQQQQPQQQQQSQNLPNQGITPQQQHQV